MLHRLVLRHASTLLGWVLRSNNAPRSGAKFDGRWGFKFGEGTGLSTVPERRSSNHNEVRSC
jgi:hypothetical protein